MKIVRIFADQLFSFHYADEKMNELRRLLTLWNDTAYLQEFVTNNKSDISHNASISALVFQLIKNANDIDDTLNDISKDQGRSLEEFFKPLDNQEYQTVELSKQKGRKNF